MSASCRNLSSPICLWLLLPEAIQNDPPLGVWIFSYCRKLSRLRGTHASKELLSILENALGTLSKFIRLNFERTTGFTRIRQNILISTPHMWLRSFLLSVIDFLLLQGIHCQEFLIVVQLMDRKRQLFCRKCCRPTCYVFSPIAILDKCTA